MSVSVQPAANAEVPKRGRGPGKPWPKGVSGTQIVAAQRAAIVAALTAELGVPLTASQQMQVEAIADLRLRAKRAPVNDAVRCVNSLAKLIAKLKAEVAAQRKPLVKKGPRTLADIMRRGRRD